MIGRIKFMTLVVVIGASLILAACGGLIADPLPATDAVEPPVEEEMPESQPLAGAAGDEEEAESGAPLVEVTFEGGMCLVDEEGQTCQTLVSILQSGDYSASVNGGEAITGQLDADSLSALREAVSSADYDAIKAQPFTDTCPIAYDGQEVTYTFYLESGTEVIASCTYVVDPTVEPFATLEGIVAGILGQQ